MEVGDPLDVVRERIESRIIARFLAWETGCRVVKLTEMEKTCELGC